jgi:putative redox protein
MPSERVTFEGAAGARLAARLDRPHGPARAYALFAHCFSCTKDALAAKHIAAGLAEARIATLRFDFTGLGHSEGEFANTHFSANVGDLIAAADHLRRHFRAPHLLVGHSLGGAAVLAAAARVPEAAAVATIAAPAEPAHLARLLGPARAELEARGEAEVVLAGQAFRIRREFLDDLQAQRLEAAIAGLGKALLVCHAPGDEVVGIENAGRIFQWARHPKSFLSLDDADHLLRRCQDARYAAGVIAAWTGRYLPAADVAQALPAPVEGGVVVGEAGTGRFAQAIAAGRHHLTADEPAAFGGDDGGPSPYDLLAAALGACTAMTLRLYAERKGLPLARTVVEVAHDRIHAEDCAECETKVGRIDRFRRRLHLEGPLDEAQRARLAEIADRCPVHRTLEGEVVIDTELA